MPLPNKWQEKLDEIKAAWGIAGEAIDMKLERLLTATNGNPTAQEIAVLIRAHVTPAAIEGAILAAVLEWKDLLKSGKSVPKKNRSALA